MSMPHCDTRSYPRQYVPVFARPHTPSYRPSMDMRSLLKALMALRDENAYALEERSGVPQATINRFLTGKHGDPRSTTGRFAFSRSSWRRWALVIVVIAPDIRHVACRQANGRPLSFQPANC